MGALELRKFSENLSGRLAQSNLPANLSPNPGSLPGISQVYLLSYLVGYLQIVMLQLHQHVS